MPSLTLHATEVPRLLAGTQTAIVRPLPKAYNEFGEPANAVHPARESGYISWWGPPSENLAEFTKEQYRHGWKAPFTVGAPLWCRETWGQETLEGKFVGIVYKADAPKSVGRILPDHPLRVTKYYFHSPVTMPREASRLTVTPTAVRVCQVYDTTAADWYACGYECWDLTYPRHPWASNPWVAVAEVTVEVKK
jgi:hypothetical protein